METNNKRYNLMVGFDQLLEVDVRNTLKNMKITPKIITDCYFYCKNVDSKFIEEVKNALKGLKFEFKAKDGSIQKVYKVRYISASKYEDSVVKTDKPTKKVKTVKLKARPKGGNKRKLKRGTHSSGTNLTNYEKKTLARVKKACKYIAKQEAKKIVVTPKKAKSKGIQKPIQQKLNFKKAA